MLWGIFVCLYNMKQINKIKYTHWYLFKENILKETFKK